MTRPEASRSAYRGDAFLVVRGAAGPRGVASERPVFVFQCYLDDSGSSDLPVVTMAGFVATQGAWEELEPKLDAMLNSHGVSVLHAMKFYGTKPPFEDWRRVRKRSFAEELFAIMHGKIAGYSVTLRRADIERAHKENLAAVAHMSPICVCFSAILVKIVSDPQLAPSIQANGLSFLVESGNPHNSGIGQYFHKMTTHPAFEGCLRGISFIDKSSCRAIQVADFLAFFSRRLMRNNDRFSGKLALPACPYIETMRRHGPVSIQGGYGAPQAVAPQKDVQGISALQALIARRERPS